MAERKTSMVIVNWNTCKLLTACVESIFQFEDASTVEVIVVDNASSDGSPDVIEAKFPAVKVIRNAGNWGYARACNIGIKAATGEFILILNSDTTLVEPICAKLVAFSDKHPDAFAVGPKLVFPDTLEHQPSCRRFPNPFIWLLLTLRLRRVLPHWRVFAEFEMENMNPSETAKVPQIMGAVMFFERCKLDQHGAFDERFWMYLEEVDLCKRGVDAGLSNYYYPEIRVTHALSKSAAKLTNTVKMAAVQKSALQYLHKHFNESFFDRSLAKLIWFVTYTFLRVNGARFEVDWRGV